MKEGFELKPGTPLEDPLTGEQTTSEREENASRLQSELLKNTMQAGFSLETPSSLLEEVQQNESALTSTNNEEDAEPTPPRFFTNPLLWLLLLILSLGGLEAYSLIKELFAGGTPGGLMVSTALLCMLLLFGVGCVKEIRIIMQFKQIDEHRQEVLQVLQRGNFAEAVRVCHHLARDSGALKTQAFTDFAQSLQPHFTPAQVFSLYERMIMKDQDTRAKEIIIRRSRENGLIVALSPLAWFDLVLTLARSLRMVRELSEVYGLRLSLLGRLQLYRRVLRNLLLIGITELATDAVVDVVGAGAVGKLNAALGQGLAAGIYSTRLGYMTMKALRPFNLGPHVLTLGQLRKELLSSGDLQRLLKNCPR